MKKFFLLISLITAFSFGQEANVQIYEYSSPTTEKIYNYITKGYKIQLDSGLDIGLKGYTIKDYEKSFEVNIALGNSKIKRINEYKLIFKDGEKLPCAIMMITKRMDNNVTSFFCIPSIISGDDLWSKLRNDIFDPLINDNSKMSDYQKEVHSASLSYYYNSIQMISSLLTRRLKEK